MSSPAPSLLELIAEWDGLGVVVRHDRPTGTWIFVALHDDTLGPATGGCRMNMYARPEDGLSDALRLAEGMTRKWAGIDFPFGGGKAVLAVPRHLAGEERRGLLRRFGELLNSLDGVYGTGEDLGTTPADMREIASVSKHVIGVHGRTQGPMDPGPFTALGVFEGIRSAIRHLTGSADLAGHSVLIEGTGHVGAPLARQLRDAGATVMLSDIDERRVAALAEELDAPIVAPEAAYDTPCEVYAPCAVGGTLNAGTISRLQCRVVAGSANNQLASPADAERLHNRGILYAPDFLINAGGAMAFTLIHMGEEREDVLKRRVSELGATLDEVFAESLESGGSPARAAQRRVARVLARGPRPV